MRQETFHGGVVTPVPLSATEEPPRTAEATRSPPLCVDLDGTLVSTDLLIESFLLLIKSNPLYLFRVPLWLLQGKAVLKAEIAARVTLQPEILPYDREIIQWIESERTLGRSVWLCTGSNEILASRVATHLNLFEGVLASSRHVNLTGEAKAAELVQRFQKGGFDYCANSHVDIAIWKHARGAIVVRGGRRLERTVERHVPILRTFSGRPKTRVAGSSGDRV